MYSSRSIRRLAILSAVAISFCLVFAARLYCHFSNYTGLIVAPSMEVVQILPDGPARDSGIRPGDRIVGVAGHHLNNFTEYLSFIKNPALEGTYLPFEVQRGTQRHAFHLRVSSYPVLHLSLFGPACGVLLLSFGLYVYFKKQEEPGSDVYLALSTCLFVLLALSNHILKATLSPLILLVWGTALILVVPVNLHFYLIFPCPKSWIRKRPLIIWTLYIIPLIFLALLCRSMFRVETAMAEGLDSLPALEETRTLIVSYLFVALASCIAFVTSLLHSFFSVDSPERKNQVRVVVIGAVSTLFLEMPAIYGVATLLSDPARVAGWAPWGTPLIYGASVLTSVILPLSMAVAILKYRLWDLDTAINRSLVYMGVSVLLIALYFFILGLLGWVFGRVVQPASHLTVLAFTLTVAAIAEPLRRMVKRIVDRTFNREAYEFRKTLGDFSRELVSIRRLEDLARRLGETVFHTLGAGNVVAVLNGEAKKDATLVTHCSGFPEQGEGVIAARVRFLAMLSPVHDGSFSPRDAATGPDLTEQEGEWVDSILAMGTELIVPIRKDSRSLGWIILREKRSESLYSSEDRELLETMANQAAVAIANALAFERIEELNRHLQEKVAKVEEQRAEILRLQERILGENRYLKDQIQVDYDFTGIVGAAHGLRNVMRVVEMAARADATALIHGETGTGKELVARAIHFNSQRKDGPFIRVNCAALAEGVLQSELFGHEKGAFTGAHERRTGRFELAEGGSIFLDEIGDISPAMQVALLRVLQEREFERVGGTQTRKADVRIIAATNRDLEKAVADGRFRMDLYYRLKVVTIEVPPLRQRSADILDLSIHFVAKYARRYGKPLSRIDDEVLNRFKSYRWPGNVREMENVIERAVVLSQSETLTLESIPLELQVLEPATRDGDAASIDTPSLSHKERISEVEKKQLVEALRLARGNKSLAARSLGLKRSTFFNKLSKYGLLDSSDQPSEAD